MAVWAGVSRVPAVQPAMHPSLSAPAGVMARLSRLSGINVHVESAPELQGFALGRGRFAQMFGVSQRDWAYERTDESRIRRRNAALERWTLRRKYVSGNAAP